MTPARIAEWKALHRDIHRELVELLVTRRMLWRTMQVLTRRRGRNHPLTRYGGFLDDAMRRAFAAYGTLAVRRMVDTRRDARSLMRLLVSIHGHASEITRTWFTSEWDADLRQVAER